MTDFSEDTGPEHRQLAMLTAEEVLHGLEEEHLEITAAVQAAIAEYALVASEAVRQGRDFLDVLDPAAGKDALHQIALQAVLEIFNEEYEAL